MSKNTKRKKSKYSPSSLKNFSTSPCFEPSKFEENEFTMEGTLLHKAVETGNTEGLNDEQKDCVKKCIRFASRFQGQEYKEVRVEYRKDSGGFIDLLRVSRPKAVVVDWKFGRSSQGDAEGNHQGKAYALGVFLKFPEIQEVEVWFVYPRRDEATTATFKRVDVEALTEEFDAIDRAAVEAKETGALTPSQACRNCGKLANCPAIANRALALAKDREGFEMTPLSAHPSEITDPATMGRLLKAAKMVEEWVKSVRYHAHRMVDELGTTPDGFEMRTRSGTRKIEDAVGAWAAVSEMMTQEEFISCCSVSPAKLEKIVMSKAARGDKKKAAIRLADELTGMGILAVGDDSSYLAESR